MSVLSDVFKRNDAQFKIFCRFLKEHGVYRNFFIYMSKCHKDTISFNYRYKHDFYWFFINEQQIYWISNAFVWDGTKEKFDFWHNISANWVRVVKGLKGVLDEI